LKKKPKQQVELLFQITSKEKPAQGEVISVGSGYTNQDGTRRELEVKTGDKVLFQKFSGSEVKVDGQEFLIMKENEILGILQ
jgi:chaperonin GroES